MDTVHTLIGELAAHIALEERSNYVLFGSAAILMNGVDLGRAIADLDIFVSDATFRSLKGRFPLRSKDASEGGLVCSYIPAENVEILKSFPGVTFEQVRINARLVEVAHGFALADLNDLKRWKETQNRPKDIGDIRAIEIHLRGSPRDT